MRFDGLIGNSGVKKTLETPFHAYIIHGTKGSGKHTLERILTASLVCQSKEKPCGKCDQCKKFLSGNHVDVAYIPTDIKVRDLREKLKDVLYLPNEAEHRVFVFYEAEKLSPVCQNTLLKIVEEPPSHAVFIFLTENAGAMLATLRSRCEMIAMEPVDEKEIYGYLQRPEFAKISDERKKTAVAFSGGYIGAAREFLSEEKSETYLKCDRFAKAVLQNRMSDAINISTFKKRDEMADFTEELYLYFTVHLRSLQKGTSEGLSEEIRSLGKEKLAKLCVSLAKLKENMKFNVNVSLFSAALIAACREMRKAEPILK
ncbi:MAG: hypothetical protein IJL30_08525 [Clostridia bacterium]|nr:hypothetical protein [Clostridia bacterium]